MCMYWLEYFLVNAASFYRVRHLYTRGQEGQKQREGRLKQKLSPYSKQLISAVKPDNTGEVDTVSYLQKTLHDSTNHASMQESLELYSPVQQQHSTKV